MTEELQEKINTKIRAFQRISDDRNLCGIQINEEHGYKAIETKNFSMREGDHCNFTEQVAEIIERETENENITTFYAFSDVNISHLPKTRVISIQRSSLEDIEVHEENKKIVFERLRGSNDVKLLGCPDEIVLWDLYTTLNIDFNKCLLGLPSGVKVSVNPGSNLNIENARFTEDEESLINIRPFRSNITLNGMNIDFKVDMPHDYMKRSV